MLLLDYLAEEKIRDAIEAGAFDNLPGAGKPLALDDDRLVPEDLRVAYRILKNAGLVPREIEARKHTLSVNVLVAAIFDNAAANR